MPSSGTSKASREAPCAVLDLDLPVDEWAKEEGIADEEIRERIKAADDADGRQARVRFGPDIMRQVEKPCCCRRSTISGASISSRSTICAR